MLFEWVWKERKTTDAKMLDIMERMADAAERQAAGVESSHKAAIDSYESTRKRNEAETMLINEERERRKVIYARAPGKDWPA